MKLDTKAVARVKGLRAKGLSFREIAKIMAKDVKTVYRWYCYGESIDNTAINTRNA